MEKSGKRSFFKEKPGKPTDLYFSVCAKIHEKPFTFIKSPENKGYAALLVKECGVSETQIQKILNESFHYHSAFTELISADLTDQGKMVVKGYTKAIDALQGILKSKLNGYGKDDAIKKDINALKERRAMFARLHFVNPELQAEPIPRSATAMFANQSYNLFLYIRKCIDKTGDDPASHASIYHFISELLTGLYDHPAYNAKKKFTPKKIKEYCDNIAFHSKNKKTSLRKYLESL